MVVLLCVPTSRVRELQLLWVLTSTWHYQDVLFEWFHFSLSCIGEGNGNPLQCSCLENPRDGGAWWAAVYGVHRVGHDWSDLAAAAAVGVKNHHIWFNLHLPCDHLWVSLIFLYVHVCFALPFTSPLWWSIYSNLGPFSVGLLGFHCRNWVFHPWTWDLPPSPDYLLLRVDCITVTESKFTLPAAWQANESEIRDEVLRQGIQFYSESQLTKKMAG